MQTDSRYHTVRVITEDMYSYTVAGKVPFSTTGGYTGDGGNASLATLRSPAGVWVDDGDTGPQVWIADTGNNVIRLVNSSGFISTVAGLPTGVAGYTGDGLPANASALSAPSSVARDSLRNITYISASAGVAACACAARPLLAPMLSAPTRMRLYPSAAHPAPCCARRIPCRRHEQ